MISIQDFQSTHVNHLGKQLVTDGVAGPETRWAMYMAQQHPLRQAFVQRAQSMLGECETPMGSNRGPHIDFWLDRCGVPVPKDPAIAVPGNAWCAAFASWCLSVPGAIEIKLARVQQLVAFLPHVQLEELQPGDLGYLLHPDGTGHVWMVIGREGGLTMNIEGNTNNAVRCTQRAAALYLRTVSPAIMPGIPPGVPMAGGAIL